MIIEAVLTRFPVSARSINPETPPRLQEIINKAIHKNIDERYQNAADIGADLQALELELDFKRKAARGNKTSAAESVSNEMPQTTNPRAGRSSKIIDSLAVLPFDNASREPEHQYLSDGIAGSLINILATVPKLRVMAQSTVFRYKGREIDPQTLGRKLNVRAVLTGKIFQSGESLRIGTELVDEINVRQPVAIHVGHGHARAVVVVSRLPILAGVVHAPLLEADAAA